MTPKDRAELEAAIDRLHNRCSTFKKINELRDLEHAATASGVSEAAATARADRVATATWLHADLGLELVTVEAAKGRRDEPWPNIRAQMSAATRRARPVIAASSRNWRVRIGDFETGVEMWSIDERLVALRIGNNPSMRICLTEAGADRRRYVCHGNWL